jgi:ferredoxin
MLSMRVIVDLMRCESNGLCVAQAPGVFEITDDDELRILQESPDESQRDAVLAAVRLCPKQALTVSD